MGQVAREALLIPWRIWKICPCWVHLLSIGILEKQAMDSVSKAVMVTIATVDHRRAVDTKDGDDTVIYDATTLESLDRYMSLAP